MRTLIGFFVVTFLSAFSQADTVNYEDLPDDPLIGIQFRCAKPTECRKLVPQDFLSGIYLQVNKGDTYSDIKNIEHVAKHNGYYVGFDDVFLSGSDLAQSPDDNYYLCHEGKNIVVDEQLADLLSPKDPLLETLTLNCPYLWVPAKDDVISDCSQKNPITNQYPWGCNGGGDSGSDLGGTLTGALTGGGDLGGGSITGSQTGGLFTGGSLNGGSLNGYSTGGTNGGGDSSGNGSNGGEPAPSPVPASGSFWNSAAGITVLVIFGVLFS